MIAKERSTRLILRPRDNGIRLTPTEFDRARLQDGYRYELVNGVLIVSPIPGLAERDPNQTLGHLLLNYKEQHPQGSSLDFTIHEHELQVGDERRRADRVIWAGLRRLPDNDTLPTIVVEFVSKRRRDRILDYETKRDLCLDAGIPEYWIIDRFQKTLTVFTRQKRQIKKRVIKADQTFRPERLPAFEFKPEDLFVLANRWE